MDGTRKFTLFVAAGVVAVSVLTWVRRPQPGPIESFLPLDGDRAIVFRRNDVQLVDRGVVRWEREGPAGATVDADGIVVVRSRRRDVPVLEAYDARDGRTLWQLLPMGEARDPRRAAFELMNLSLLATDNRVIAFHGHELRSPEADFVRVSGIDARTGVERWHTDLSGAQGAYGPAWLRGTSLVVFTWNALSLIDATSGTSRAQVAADPDPCVTATHAWFTSGGQLHALSLADGAIRTLPRPIDAPLQLHGLCAMHDGWLWVAASDRYGQKADAFAPMWMLALDPATGALQAQIDLGSVRVGSPDDQRAAESVPDTLPLSGEATRFVPLVVEESRAAPRMLMLDLDTRRVAWETEPSERFKHLRLLRAGSSNVAFERDAHLLASFAGASGELTGAATVPRAPEIHGEHVWVTDGETLTRLDPKTLAPAKDARADAETLFAQGSR